MSPTTSGFAAASDASAEPLAVVCGHSEAWTLVLFGWNAKNFKDPPPLPVPSSRKQMEQAPAWADESPPVLPQRGREGECKEWKRQEERSIRFSQSACFSWIFRLDLSVDLYFKIKKT